MLTPAGVRERHAVHVDDERIVAVEPSPPGSESDVDLLAPGFVDLQVNGHDDVDVVAARGGDWDRLDGLLLAQGVTTWFPTVVTAPLDALERRIARMLGRVDGPARGPRPDVGGVHLEGPFLGEAHGAHADVPAGPVDVAWLDGLPEPVRIVTLGPEREGALEAIRSLTARGVVVALGHTTASLEATTAAVDAGARLFTHVFNASGPLHHRRPGALGAALTDDRLTVTLIADGVHVHPAVIRLVWRAKPAGGVVLVTDAVAWRSARSSDRGVAHVDGAPRLPDGTLAGSSLTMPEAVRGAVTAGVDLADALTAASTTPAALLGLADRGAIAPGRRADLVALDGGLRVQAVWCGGALAAQPPAGNGE